MRGARAKSGPGAAGRRLAAGALSLAALAGAGGVSAQARPGGLPPQPGAAINAPTAAPPRHRLLYRNTTVLRVNPIGLFNETRLGYRRRIFESESLLLRDTFVGAGLALPVSPAGATLVPSIEIQPLAVFQFTASYYANAYFGNFDHLQSFATASAPHDDTTREQRGDAGQNYATTVGQLILQPLLQFKAGPIAARTATRFVYSRARLRDGDRTFYDPIFDLLVPRRGWIIANDSDLVAVTPWGLSAGVRYSVVHALYGADDFTPGTPHDAPNQTIQRVGPLATYTFFDRPGARFNTPTIIVLAQWWLDHASRTGQDTSRALPYVIAGFSFSGDLL